MNKRVYGQILVTKDYGEFTFLLGNRDINELHVERLVKSISKHQLIVPIIVNDKMEIIDGQHRYEACKTLGFPLYYTIQEGYGLEECHTLNAVTKKYSAENFLQGYAALGKEEYVKFKEFRQTYPFLSIHLCQIYLTGGIRRDKQGDFKSGDFKILDYLTACRWAEQACDFKEYTGIFFTNRNFHTTLLRIFKHEKYDHSKMMQKMSIKGGELRHHAREKYFIENICDIYNYKTRDEDRIYPHELTR